METKRDRALAAIFAGLLVAVGIAIIVFLSMVNLYSLRECRTKYDLIYCLFVR